MTEIKEISENELLTAIRDLLRTNGYLNKITAEILAESTELHTVEPTITIYLPTISEKTSGDDVLRLVTERCQGRILQRLQTDRASDFRSYALHVQAKYKDVLLDPDFWPAGIMRAQVTELLRERQLEAGDRISKPPKPTEDVLLVNELIREYLEWNGYLYTASVMSSEAAMPKEKKCRAYLCADVGVKDDEKSSSLPLLSNIVSAYTERIRRKMNKSKIEKA